MARATSQEWLIAEKLARKIAANPDKAVGYIADVLAKHTASARKQLERRESWLPWVEGV